MLNINTVVQLEVTLGEMAARGLLADEPFPFWVRRAETQPDNPAYLYLYPLNDGTTTHAVVFWIHESPALFADVVGFLNDYSEETLEAECKYRWVV